MSKNLFFLFSLLLLAACQQPAASGENGADAPETAASTDALAPDAMAAAFAGKWQSTVDTSEYMQFANNLLTRYKGGRIVSQSNFTFDPACAGCFKPADKPCFQLPGPDGKPECYPILKMTSSSLDYVSLGEEGYVFSFVRVAN